MAKRSAAMFSLGMAAGARPLLRASNGPFSGGMPTAVCVGMFANGVLAPSADLRTIVVEHGGAALDHGTRTLAVHSFSRSMFRNPRSTGGGTLSQPAGGTESWARCSMISITSARCGRIWSTMCAALSNSDVAMALK